MNKSFLGVLGVLVVFFLISCEKNDTGSISLTFKGENQSLKSANSGLAADVKITDFQLSIRDVEFKLDESDLDSSEVQFRGPFDVDLMSETDALNQTIGNLEVEDGTYKIIRFKLHKSREREESDPLYDRSVVLNGTIDGTPFEFWHDTSENFDVENSEGIIVSGTSVNVVVKFKIDDLLTSLHSIDLSQATDTNENGLIEINPDNDDGNGDIADQLKENIKMAADLIKE